MYKTIDVVVSGVVKLQEYPVNLVSFVYIDSFDSSWWIFLIKCENSTSPESRTKTSSLLTMTPLNPLRHRRLVVSVVSNPPEKERLSAAEFTSGEVID